ncbi:ERF family protein [Shinella sp. H4-D48]|uniref:ERF family protein n=1 Tax=Shinella sp. H4-D48 TaxID=2925841 RepID=UPI001F53C988|nr:ERF family protein [Shinella sp. H4-D48]UNK39338.1 ERF family protein [Shinella sp. H4-D48]
MADATLNVHQRLAAAMGDVDYIQKEKRQGMNYTIVSHDAVTAKVRPVLLNHGIVYYPVRCEHVHNGNRAECSLTVRFVNIDEPTDYFDVPTFGYGIDSQDKGPGKAMSYAVKYALLKALGLETGDDPDNESVNYNQEDPHKKKVTAAEQKRQLEEIDKDLLDAHTTGDVKRLFDIWFSLAERDGWSKDYWDAARRKFAAKKKEIEDADDFPGDKPGRITDSDLRNHPMNAG